MTGAKISELSKQLGKGEAALISSDANRLYLTGFDAEDALLLLTAEGGIFLTDSRYTEAAEKKLPFCELRQRGDLAELLSERKTELLHVEAEQLSLAQADRLEKSFPRLSLCSDGRLDKRLKELRSLKDEEEKEKIRQAQRISEEAFLKLREYIRPGVTEKELASRLDFLMCIGGAQRPSFDTIVLAGPDGSLPHGVPSDRRLEEGDLVTVDFGAVFEGYHSDTTRTFAVGRADAEKEEIYELVLEAQLAGLKAVRAGLPCSELDSICRSVISKAGYGEAFRHASGHGVGIEIHEAPSVSGKSEDILRAGNVVTVEPGIYLEGRFGVRIEDTVFVTEDGCENIAFLPKTPTLSA